MFLLSDSGDKRRTHELGVGRGLGALDLVELLLAELALDELARAQLLGGRAVEVAVDELGRGVEVLRG